MLIGQVGSGTLQAGTSVTISPAQIQATVKSIQMYGEDLKTAEAWDNVGVCIEGPGVKSVLPGQCISTNLLVWQAVSDLPCCLQDRYSRQRRIQASQWTAL